MPSTQRYAPIKGKREELERMLLRAGQTYENLSQVPGDIAENVAGLPGAALTVGTGLVGQTGAGLGTLAGMTADVLRKVRDPATFKRAIGGEGLRAYAPDMDVAAENIQDVAGRFTYAPQTQGEENVLSGLETAGAPLEEGMQYATEAIAGPEGSPALKAGIYAGLNLLDPENLLPMKATAQALRGAQNIARSAQFEPITPKGGPGAMGQAGAWVPGDIAEAPGTFEFRSPTTDAFDRLKPQERKNLSGKQLMKALTREGAKKEEMQWMGLDKILDTDEIMSVDDVKRLVETNKPKLEFSQRRAGEGGEVELDEDAISEQARQRAWEDEDLTYPIVVRRSTGRGRYETLETFDTEREAERWLEEYRNDARDNMIESEEQHYRETIGEHFDEEQLAEMSEQEKDRWVEERARDSVNEMDDESLFGEELEVTQDTDSEPTNIDDLTNYWEERIRENPEDYGIEGGTSSDAPSYGEYTVGREGAEPEANYTVATGRLTGESRFGRGIAEPEEFMVPYMREAEIGARSPAAQAALDDAAKNNPELAQALAREREPEQMTLLPEPAKSKAFEREALRRQQVVTDPNAQKYIKEANLSHYREFGPNQMYFTRETDRPAPPWGTVQQGVGRVSDEGLQMAGEAAGTPLPATTQADRPLRMLEEAQSDWYQKGRKAGWADPKDIAEREKQVVDTQARMQAFKQQAVGEMNNLWTNPQVQEALAEVGGMDSETQRYYDQWQAMQPGGAQERAYDTPEQLMEARVQTGEQLAHLIANQISGQHPAYELLMNTTRGLSQLRDMNRLPGMEGLIPSGPMRETKQYTQLALADALRRAVQEGQQYLAWTPGDVHAQRWGTESMQFAPHPDDPRRIVSRFGQKSRGYREEEAGTVLEQLQRRADELRDNPELASEEFHLDDPNIEQSLTNAVERYLNYGMSDYPDPQAQMRARAGGIRKQMEEASAEYGAGGERTGRHYSPRAVGYEAAYGPMEEHLRALLKRSGLELPPIRDIRLPGTRTEDTELPMRGFEIDPEIARAAKKGFILPY